MGKHQCLELLLQHHTLFAEEEIVTRLLPQALHRLTATAHKARRSLSSSSLRRSQAHHLPVAPDGMAATGGSNSSSRSNHPTQLALPSSPAGAPPSLGSSQQHANAHPLSAPGALQGRRHHQLPHGHHHRHCDSLALDADADMALRRAISPKQQHHPHHHHDHDAQQHGYEHEHDGGHGQQQQPQHALDDEICTLVNLAFCSWSRDCLDLLIIYGSNVFADKEEEEEEGAWPGPDDPDAKQRWGLLRRRRYDHEASSTQRHARLRASLRGRLYARVGPTPLETRLRLVAAAALHHPRDLQWMLDRARGDVLGHGAAAGHHSGGGGGSSSSSSSNVVGFVRRVFRKIKHDQKSTKDMKLLAMRALCEAVVAAGLLLPPPPANGSSEAPSPVLLQIDLSSMGIDDAYLEHALQSLWDITATGAPTELLLDNNALTDVGVRALVLQYRANMAAAAAAAARLKGRPHSPLGHSAVSVSGASAGGGGARPLSPLSAAGSGHAGGGAVPASFIGQRQQPHAPPSIVALSLNNNEVGTDGALFLADLIADSHAALASVTAYKTECSVASPTSLAFDRVVDRSLSLEAALVVAILVDAYVGLRRFVFTLREAEGPLPLAMARLNLLNELDLRGNLLEGPLLPSLLLVHRKHLGGGNRLGLPAEGLQELAHALAIDCAGSGLTGPIPSSWGHPHALPMLKALDLSENPALDGPVPAGTSGLLLLLLVVC